jgi:hypothetical protein
MASGVAGLHPFDALELEEGGLETPEAPAGQGGHFASAHHHTPLSKVHSQMRGHAVRFHPAIKLTRGRPRVKG